MLKKPKLPERNHTTLVVLRRSDAWSLGGQDEDTGLLRAASPRPGQTQLHVCKATASPCCLDHNEHFALQCHSLFRACLPQHFWLLS